MADGITDMSQISNNELVEGKSNYYQEVLSLTHSCIRPSVEYEKNQKLGLRDIAIQGFKQLEKGEKVAIVDENASFKSRDSFVKLIKKKVPSASISMVEILPEFGCRQLFWSREFRAAAASLGTNDSVNTAGDGTITRWYDCDAATEVKYRHGVVDAVRESEDSSYHQLKLPIYAQTTYKFEVPALLIQWDCLTSLMNDDKLATGKLRKILRQWVDVNPCGRILLVSDGAQIRTGERSRSQQKQEIINIVQQLSASFHESPLYVTHIDNHGVSGGYVVPPKPGLLAFLQCRHCLHLHSKHSMYLYESQSHMKMAEQAGVRHIKMARVLEHPSLVVSSHAATVPPIPEMLKHIKFQPTDTVAQGAAIPLYDMKAGYQDGHIHASLGNGRVEFLFAAEWEIIERYQNLYASQASTITETGSKMSPEKASQSVQNDSKTSLQNLSKSVLGTSGGSRDLPKWMLGKSGSTNSTSSAELSRLDSTSSTETKVRKTVYVMTEKELSDLAAEILKQAGKDDLLQKLLSEQKSKVNNEATNVDQANKTTTANLNTKRAKMRVASKRKNDPTVSADDRIYPKMEIEDNSFDIANGSFQQTDMHRQTDDSQVSRTDSSDIDSDMDIAEDRHTSVNNIEEVNARVEKVKERDEMVSDLLEDFDQSNIQRRISPRKKARMKSDVTEDDPKAAEACVFNLLENTFNDTTTYHSSSRARSRSGKKSQKHQSGYKHLEPATSDTMDRIFRDVDEKIRKQNLHKFEDSVDSVSLQRGTDIRMKEQTVTRSKLRETPDLSILDDLF